MIERISNTLWWAMVGLALILAYPVFGAEKRVCVRVKMSQATMGSGCSCDCMETISDRAYLNRFHQEPMAPDLAFNAPRSH